MLLSSFQPFASPAQRAAIVCSRIIRNHPLPDGNKRASYLCMLIQLERAGLTFKHPDGDQDETANEAFVEWVKARTIS
jgi:prophage maintenance system killer protein